MAGDVAFPAAPPPVSTLPLAPKASGVAIPLPVGSMVPVTSHDKRSAEWTNPAQASEIRNTELAGAGNDGRAAEMNENLRFTRVFRV